MDTERLLARLSPQARGELLSRLDGPVPRNTRPAARQPVRRRARRAQDATRRPFDLETDPPPRTWWVRQAGRRPKLMLVVHQRQLLDQGARTERAGYWRRRRRCTEPLEIPTDKPRGRRTGQRGETFRFAVAAGVADLPTPLPANGNGGRRTVARLALQPQAPAQSRYIAPRGATVDNPTVVGLAAHIERVSGAAG